MNGWETIGTVIYYLEGCECWVQTEPSTTEMFKENARDFSVTEWETTRDYMDFKVWI